MGLDIAEERKKRAEKEKRNTEVKIDQKPPKTATTKQKKSNKGPQINCTTCKEGTMKATKISKFGSGLRFIGYIIAIPSGLGVTFAFLMLLTSIASSSGTTASDAEQAGVAIASGIGIVFSLGLGASALVGGLIGWVLLMKRKVFKCVNCGFILDRG